MDLDTPSSPELPVSSPFRYLLNPAADFVPEGAIDPPRKRGRPRKYFDTVEGKLKHNMDDSPPAVTKLLSHQQQRNIERQFKNLYGSSQVLKDIITLLASTYGISYGQAHEALVHLF